jgi:radical SAM superfamily enzyme YgiQ (UPF0313 family)
MHVLLLYPVLPAHILQFRGSMARLGKKSFYPPMGLLTIAAISPQADDFHAQIKMPKARGIPVAVGGPYPTALPEEEANSGADFMVLNEGEITVPMFLQYLDAGATSGTCETEDKPDITETPDKETLVLTKKKQNVARPINESLEAINKAGLSVIAGMIIGFDCEKKGAGQRIVDFMNEAAIPVTNFGILQALPTKALWDRLDRQKRLLSKTGDGMSTKPMNFTPTRPACDIIQEYIDANWQLYGHKSYLNRVAEYCIR